MISVKEFERLQRLVEAKQREADQAEGAYKQLMGRLKDEFGCTTLKEAKAKLSKMEQQVQDQSAAFDKAYAAFVAEHGEEINA